MPETLTVIVPTFNEEENVRDCLESLTWADDIFVVDSFSTDRTLAIAQEYTDHVVRHEYVNPAAQKNWAIPQCDTDWIMSVDADERVTPELQKRVQSILADGTPYDGFYVRRMTTFFGKMIRHCGWHHDYPLRLWRRGKGKYVDVRVHEHVTVEGGNTGRIHEYLIHHTYKSFPQYLEKFGRYTTWAAEDLHQRGRQPTLVNLTLRPMWRFFKQYVLQRGFLDGKRGVMLCILSAFSVFMKYAKLWDLRRRDRQQAPPQT